MKQPGAIVEAKFNQSESVQRSRAITEAKLKGAFALTKLADEEVTMLSANLEETRQQLRTQLFEQRAQDTRVEVENADFRKNFDRKHQLSDLVDRLGIMKKFLRFQEESRERDQAFKGIIRNKRIAFRLRLARLEQRQVSERNELLMAQKRLIETRERIHAIELAAMKDTTKADQRRKENEMSVQQSHMRQQKETEFLRELQLRKARQLSEINEIEIANSEELEEMGSVHKYEEFELLAKHARAEAELQYNIDKQRSMIESSHLLEKQKIARSQMQRAQRKQANSMLKAQKSAIRAREKMMIAENPIIRGGTGAITNAEGEDGFSDGQSSAGSRSQSSAGLSEASSTWTEEQAQQETDFGGTGAGGEEQEGDEAAKEAQANAQVNRDSPALMSEEQRELNAYAEQARERLSSMLAHQKTSMNELKSVQKHQISLKTKEHRRKVADAIKEHQDEIEALKQDQIQLMEDLIASQEVAVDKENADAINTILSISLPGHIISDINAGRTPESVRLTAITVFCVEIPSLVSLASELDAAALMEVLRAVTERVEAVLSRSDDLFRLETGAGTWLVATGLNQVKAAVSSPPPARRLSAISAQEAAGGGTGDRAARTVGIDLRRGPAAGPTATAAMADDDIDVRSDETDSGDDGAAGQLLGAGLGAGGAGHGFGSTEDDARVQVGHALKCVDEIMQLEFGDIPVLKDVEEQVQLRVGVSTGSAIGGLVGAKVGKYQLFGEAVQKCMELCRAAPAGTVNVAPETQALMD